jgi:hypothetical protein
MVVKCDKKRRAKNHTIHQICSIHSWVQTHDQIWSGYTSEANSSIVKDWDVHMLPSHINSSKSAQPDNTILYLSNHISMRLQKENFEGSILARVQQAL